MNKTGKMFLRHFMIAIIVFYFVRQGYLKLKQEQTFADQLLLDYAMLDKRIYELIGFHAPVPLRLITEHSLQIVQMLTISQICAAVSCGFTLGRLSYLLVGVVVI